MTREVLTDLIAENRIDNIRIIQSNDPVIGGQPNDNEDEFSSNISARDLACTIKYSLEEIKNLQKIKVKDEQGTSKTDPASQRLVTESFDLIDALPTSNGYSSTRQYRSGELVFIDGIWYEAYHPDGCKDKDPRDKANRPSGWNNSDVHAPYYWVEIGKYLMLPEVGSAIPLATVQVREGLIKYRNDGQLSAQKFWRIAEQNPNLVKNGFIEISDLRANVIRGLDDGKNIDIGRVINSYQEDAMQQIKGSFTLRDVDPNGILVSTDGVITSKLSSNQNAIAASGTMKLSRELNIDSAISTRIANEARTKNIAMLMCCRI